MSCRNTSSTLLDHGFCGGGGGKGGSGDSFPTSRYNSFLGSGLPGGVTSTLSSSYGQGSGNAIDRYYSFLDDIRSPPSSSNRYLSSSPHLKSTDHFSITNHYSSRYLLSDHRVSSGSGARSRSSGYSSSFHSGNGTSNDYQHLAGRYSRPMISGAPTYDKYGKELSNYDRWRVQHGENVNNLNNNCNNNSGLDIVSKNHSFNSDLNQHTWRRKSRIEDDSPTLGSSNSILINSSRELSVMPGASVTKSFENHLAASLPSRFANLTTDFVNNNGNKSGIDSSISYSNTRGKSLVPIISLARDNTSNNNYSSSYGGDSSKYQCFDRSTKSNIILSFPICVSTKLAGYDIQDVIGDGGCFYRCLSLYFTGCEDNYNKYRREVVGYIRENMDNYSSMIKSEIGYASTNDYFSRKMRTDHQEFAETTEIIATCCLYNINIHVLALVPGKRTWEWLHFDPSIGSGNPSTANKDIYLYNQGSVHFMLCSPK